MSSMAAMIRGVSQPEIQRQVRQQRADIDALHELVERVDQKVDALDVKLDRRFDEISGHLTGSALALFLHRMDRRTHPGGPVFL